MVEDLRRDLSLCAGHGPGVGRDKNNNSSESITLNNWKGTMRKALQEYVHMEMGHLIRKTDSNSRLHKVGGVLAGLLMKISV